MAAKVGVDVPVATRPRRRGDAGSRWRRADRDSLAAAHVRSAFAACGVERWPVKTLQDRPRLLPLRRTTIAWLCSRPAPDGLPAARLPLERRIFQVVGTVTLVRPEDDSDLHVCSPPAAGT